MIGAFSGDELLGYVALGSIFALFILPFACLVLAARSRLGWGKVVWALVALLAIVPAMLSVVARELLTSGYFRFQGKSQRYYENIARACDSILNQHPLGTNNVIRIAGNDASVAKIIRRLDPDHINVSANRVYVKVGPGRAGYGVSWEPHDQSHWVLTVYGEGVDAVVYTEPKYLLDKL